MIKNISKLECKIGERVYQLLCDMDSPLNEVKEALYQYIKYIGHIEDAARASQEAEAPISEEQQVIQE